MIEACSTLGRDEKCMQNFGRNSKGRGLSEDIDIRECYEN
jgi:hypothetical protein